jgi:hypothetical protein
MATKRMTASVPQAFPVVQAVSRNIAGWTTPIAEVKAPTMTTAVESR